MAWYAIGACERVQASRAAFVTAREEQRRRIRRDRHHDLLDGLDGLDPTLALIKLQLSAVERLLDVNPQRAAVLLSEVREGYG
jgi:hypothetical protein